MRLLSLTLHGFKSFGDRTTIEFSPGVTAVVGPNGSGKSNLIEALRWASGGGRASEYRAGEKTDLIFHGAGGKRRVGYAEVAIELRTSHQSYRIVRNLFRDGTGKLKLNGRNARFMDIDEALSGSGLGRSSLAVIGQGEVGQVLMASPEKLLDYVAEAAGVAKLNSRREQTTARLADAQSHLTRLEDLFRALEGRVEGLRTEAAQATRFSALSAEQLRLRYSLAVMRESSLATDIDKLETDLAQEADALAAGRTELRTAQETWQRLREQSSQLETAYRESLTRAEAKKGDVRVASERVKGLTDRHHALDRELTTVTTEQVRLSQMPAPIPPSEAIEELKVTAEQAQAASQAAQQQLRKLNDDYAAKRETVVSLQRQLEREKAAHLNYQALKAQLETQQAELETRVYSLDAGDDLDALLLEQQEATTKAENLQEQLSLLNEQVVNLQQKHAEAFAEAAALERTAARSRQAFEARRGFAQGPKHALTSGIAGVLGAVADLIKVPNEYRLALASALGRRAEYVVVDTAATAQRVLAHVKRQGGWVTVLPLDLVQDRQATLPPTLRAAEGVLGLATDNVEVDTRYASVLRQLLGTTTLIRDLDDGVALARQHSSRPRLISLAGEVLESYGALSGGQQGTRASVIGVASELEEAEAAALEARQLETVTREQLVQAQAGARELKDEAAEALKTSNRLNQVLTEKRQALAVKTSLTEEWREQIATLTQRLGALEEPVVVADATQLDRLEVDLTKVEASLKDAQAVALKASESFQASQSAFTLAQERWKQYALQQEQFEQNHHHMQTLELKRRDLAEIKDAVARQLDEAKVALERAEQAIPTDIEARQHLWQNARQASEEAEARLVPLSETQAARAERLEELKITLARREAALELATEERERFPVGLDLVELSARACRERLSSLEAELEQLGSVNHRAADELEREQSRLDELEGQMAEGSLAVEELASTLARIDQETTERLTTAVEVLRSNFKKHVSELFGAEARADVVMIRDDERPQGLTIMLQPPGKQTQSLNLLSVGERTMGAMAFLFSLMQGERALPLAVLDEVDAPLDEANIRRYCAFLDRLAKQGTQFVLITHQKATFDVADVLWGVTSDQGVSRIFSISRNDYAVA